ncbi:MAG: hypothetical protein SFX72_22690 [Isosphaeraceae bacterium]|nr:hypothetical protein [Isosphaeraceae bacterium]
MDHARRRFLKALAACSLTSAWRRTSRSATIEAPPARALTRGPRFHWRGYYDKLLFDPSDRYILANEVEFEGRSPRPDDSIAVGMIDLCGENSWTELARTVAWNWQQGCMLQWIPGSASRVAWNDRDGEQFVTRIHDVVAKTTRTLPRPFYCLAPDGKTAFAPDFRRLNDTRPGYGYGGVVDPHRDQLAPRDSGIERIDMRSGESRLIFSLADAAKIPYEGRPETAFHPDSKHWFNHLLVNPDGSRLFFLHRWKNPGARAAFFTRAITVDLDGSRPFVIDPHGGTSHFVWRDPERIFAWAWHPSHGERFYLYRDRSRDVEVVGKDVMTRNGHNTYVPNTNLEWVLNDTYPDPRGNQNPYLYHLPSNRRVSLGEFASPPAYRGEWRCDTHPCASRDGRTVVFDSPHAGGRQVYLVEISSIIGRS